MHIMHIYENPDLQFADLKELLKLLSASRIPMFEKVDGAQIFLTFRDGHTFAARNKKDLKHGGMDAKGLIDRDFKGGDRLRQVYIGAFNAFGKAVSQIQPNIQNRIFHHGQLFLNCEIVGNAFRNAIHYDDHALIIHQSGHMHVDLQTGEIFPHNLNENAIKLIQKTLESIQQSKIDYNLRFDSVIKLNPLETKQDLKILLLQIDKLLQIYGLDDKSTIKDFNKKIKKDENVVENPLEILIHDFGVELLKGLESAYISDNDKEIQRLKLDLKSAINIIRNSNNEKALQILQKQLSKIKNFNNITTACEGIVFEYDGNMYKITGNFAPINQIHGLLAYGRGGDIPAMGQEQAPRQDLEEIEVNPNPIEHKNENVVAIVPGSFKPPHAGHMGMIEHISNLYKINKFIIIISPKPRIGYEGDSEVTIDKNQSLKLWQLYTDGDPRFDIIVSTDDSPVKTAFGIMKTLQHGDTVVLGMSKKEKDTKDSRFDSAQKFSDDNNLGLDIKIIETPLFGNGISGMEVRDLIAKGDRIGFQKCLPKHLNSQQKEIAWDIVTTQQDISEELSYQQKMVKKHPQWKKDMIGRGGNENVPPYTKKPSMKRSKSAPPMGENIMERKDLYERIILKNTLVKIIKEVKQKENDKDEKYLRNFIKKILMSEAVRKLKFDPHDTTGINVLETLLEKIIPILEKDYKTLTTSIEQRKSFRAHVISACKSLIKSLSISGVHDPDEMLNIDEEDVMRKEGENPGNTLDGELGEGSMNEVGIEIGDTDIQKSPEDKYIPIDDRDEPSEEEKQKKNFSLPGEDTTGRNIALESMKKIQKQIIQDYSILANEEDRQIFYEYLLTNLKLYFDKFETELSPLIDEPTTDAYEDEKDKVEDEGDAVGGEEL